MDQNPRWQLLHFSSLLSRKSKSVRESYAPRVDRQTSSGFPLAFVAQ